MRGPVELVLERPRQLSHAATIPLKSFVGVAQAKMAFWQVLNMPLQLIDAKGKPTVTSQCGMTNWHHDTCDEQRQITANRNLDVKSHIWKNATPNGLGVSINMICNGDPSSGTTHL